MAMVAKPPASRVAAPPDVFASYAQLDRDRHLQKFVRELENALSARLGPTGATSVVFFDRDDVEAGDHWSEKILENVRTARALVCLMSPTYLTREWCGRELEVFLQRQELLAAVDSDARFIYPLWWQPPATPRPLPRPLAALHYRDGRFPPDYESLGARGLARLGRWGQFRTLVERLAEVIAVALDPTRQQLPPGREVADVLAIANAFDEIQPRDVRLLALTPGGDAWHPSSHDLTVAAAAAKTARRLQTFVRPLEPGHGLEARLEQAAAEEQVLLVVAAADEPPPATMGLVNGLDLPSLAVLLVDTREGDVIERWRRRFPDGAFQAAVAAGLVHVASVGEMQAEMERLVDEARRKLQAKAPAAAVADPVLVREARRRGIVPTVRPSLTGPGGIEPR